ncbi:AraC family transcriptional regulator [Actinosynnema sp.]|uniref:AraC family transcriptional regulator n=1 Tax=Actinosynnema sp. TaxID=1872144 RepID=UPI003F8374A6
MPPLADPAVRHWDFPRGVAGVALLVRFGVERGLAETDQLAGTGLVAADLVAPDGEVSAHQELRVVRALAEALPDAGVELGGRYHATTFGVLGFAFLSSRSVRDAVDVALRFLDLSFAFCIPSASVSDGLVRVLLDPTGLPDPVGRFLAERDLAAVHSVIGELLPGGLPLRSVVFGFPEPGGVAVHERAFGLRPVFGAPVTAAVYDAGLLDRPLPQADPHTVAACEAQCRRLVARRLERGGISHEVRERLAGPGALDGGMDRVARELSVSTRTLRRRLAGAGTSYRELLDEVREALAERLLRGGALSVEEAARRLGYAEASSFIHAFKRWKGVTPATWRGGGDQPSSSRPAE